MSATYEVNLFRWKGYQRHRIEAIIKKCMWKWKCSVPRIRRNIMGGMCG